MQASTPVPLAKAAAYPDDNSYDAVAFFASAPSIRATWLWNTELITEKGEAILSFAEENDINRIYLHIDQKNVPPEAYRTFIKEASARDIQVDALGGDPAWSLVSSQKALPPL